MQCVTRYLCSLLLSSGVMFGLATVRTALAWGHEVGGPGSAQRPLWVPAAEQMLGPPDPTRRIVSQDYRVFDLDRDSLAELLGRAPREGAGKVGDREVLIPLPWPDGTSKVFRIIDGSVLKEGGLQVRCPEGKTYLGQGTDDRRASALFEWNPSGFRARVYADETEVYIEPYSPGDTRHYIVYFARDRRTPGERTEGASPVSVPPAAFVPQTEPLAASIEEVAIERQCFGCENLYKLTVRRDGTVILNIFGVLGTVHTCEGRVPPDDFVRLANLIQTEGFFGMNEDYRDPRLRDGTVLITSVVTGGKRKVVTHLHKVGPASLKAIEDAIHALGDRVSWTEARP
jgi:hypothetical protein